MSEKCRSFSLPLWFLGEILPQFKSGDLLELDENGTFEDLRVISAEAHGVDCDAGAFEVFLNVELGSSGFLAKPALCHRAAI